MSKELQAISLLYPNLFDGDNLSISSFLECDPKTQQELMLKDSFYELVKNSILNNADIFADISHELPVWGDKQLVLALINSVLNASALRLASDPLKDDKEVVSKAVGLSGSSLRYASERLKDNREVVISAINNSSKAFEFASPRLQNDKNIALLAIRYHGDNLEFVSAKLLADKEIVLAAVQNTGSAIEYASAKMKADKEIFLLANKKYVDHLRRGRAKDEITANKHIVLAAVQNNGGALEYASDELKADKEIVLAAVQNNGGALEYANDELKADKEIILAAIQSFGPAIKFASNELKADQVIILAALQNNGGALESANDDLQSDKEIVLAAVKDQGGALEYASEKLRDDKEIVLAAVKDKGGALEYASEKLRDNKEIVLAAVQNNRYALKYASEELQVEIKGKKDAHDLTDEQDIIDFFGDDSDMYFEDLSDKSQEIITSSSGLMELLLQSDECDTELFYYFDDLEEVLSNELKNDLDLLQAAVEVRPTLLAAFDSSIITPEIYIAALNHPWVDNQDEMDTITCALDCQNINDKLVNAFLENNYLGCSNIFQIVSNASHKNLNIDSIISLLNSLIEEVSHNTNQINDSNGFLYGGNDYYYHWTERINWSSFLSFLNDKDLLKNRKIITCLNNVKITLSEHFENLNTTQNLSSIMTDTYQEPKHTIFEWLDGLQELIDVSERK